MEEKDITQQIHKFLIDNDWSVYQEDDMFHYKKQLEQNTGIVIVNGKQIKQEPQYIDIELVSFGLGSIDETVIYGYSVLVNGNMIDSVYVDSFEDFQKEIYSKFE